MNAYQRLQVHSSVVSAIIICCFIDITRYYYNKFIYFQKSLASVRLPVLPRNATLGHSTLAAPSPVIDQINV